MRSPFMYVALSLAISAASSAPLVSGCATTNDSETGTLQLALQQVGSDGAVYQLSGQFQIDGPGGTQTVDATGFTPSVTLTLPPGITSVWLRDGWTLAKSTDGGATYTPVSALLGSLNPYLARVLANVSDTIVFQFLIRDSDGQETISFGVVPHPRELAGGVVASAGTGDYTSYARARLDFAIYHDLASTERVNLSDGGKDLVLTAGPVAVEIFNDTLGLLSGTVAPLLAGGSLQYHFIARPDGTQEVSGELDGLSGAPFSTLVFGPSLLELGNLPLDADGFPTDVFFNEPLVSFALTTEFDSGEAVLRGNLRFRSIPVAN